MKSIMLIGNPNCGKTTLFNGLTGDNQRVGNWPGVTVEKKSGFVAIKESKKELIDLPGIYSLSIPDAGASQDEKIAAHALATASADIIINVVDACHLERHLYLTTQLLELKKPMIIALNMMDIAAQRGISIDIARLSKRLHCPVIPLQAHKKIGIDALKDALVHNFTPGASLSVPLPPATQELLLQTSTEVQTKYGIAPELAPYYAARIIEGDTFLLPQASWYIGENDVMVADVRYRFIHTLLQQICKKKSDVSEHITAKIDKVVLNRFLALPIFLGMMYLMFLFAINIGGAFQDFFDLSTSALFVQGSAWLLNQMHTPLWLIGIIANGVGVGINTTLTFIPVIAAMYFFLAVLEASGYMARAAFVVDKIMRLLGLPGKSFVPMIVGFGCNVPAIMSARTLDSERDRLLTVLMSPFMSCSARLAIYAVFVAAFFPSGGDNVVFSLYLIGIVAAVGTGLLLRKTVLGGNASALVIELPAYHLPTFGRLFKETSLRLRFFIWRAAKMIIPVCILLGGLNAITIDGGLSAETSSHSLLSWLGRALTPVFAPLGIESDNWPATVGLLSGMLAKEVVIGTLNSLYAQIGHAGQLVENFALIPLLKEALLTIPNNLMHLGEAITNPILASAPDNEISHSMYGIMASRFHGAWGAYSYLLFILLYIPCVSTMAAIRQEANRTWMWFSVAWSLLIAYAAAGIFYQAAFFLEHPVQSSLWILAMLGAVGLFILFLYFKSKPTEKRYVISHS